MFESITSQTSESEREQILNDRFNGILDQVELLRNRGETVISTQGISIKDAPTIEDETFVLRQAMWAPMQKEMGKIGGLIAELTEGDYDLVEARVGNQY